MFVINSANLPQHFLEIFEQEEKRVKEYTEKYIALQQRFESAQNLKNEEELKTLNKELQALHIGMNSFMSRKIIVMSMMINKNKNFKDN